MTDKEKISILTNAINEMALFIRQNPPASLPEDNKSMSLQDFCRCFVEADSDPLGKRIRNYFITKAYKKGVEK